MKKCKMCYKDKETMRCDMSGKIIIEDDYKRYCVGQDLRNVRFISIISKNINA